MHVPANASPLENTSAIARPAARSMNSRLLLWALVSALAGFLFGFDTVVISGAEKTI
jgi:hypothetical protein